MYESDIQDFFNSVDLGRLQDRLTAIYADDPVSDAILAWMRADIIFEGEILQRRNGLPQGSPFSPLMANLMLDDFDNDMQTQGFRLIRFADDFIVLCKNPEQARAAGEAARLSLQEHGLRLHPDKVARAYTPDSQWRNRAEFIRGREQIVDFLQRKWKRELDYRLIKEAWAFTANRIAVRFAYEWHDDTNNWFRSLGNENWEFDDAGLMRRRIASINDLPITEAERLYHWPLGPRPEGLKWTP